MSDKATKKEGPYSNTSIGTWTDIYGVFPTPHDHVVVMYAAGVPDMPYIPYPNPYMPGTTITVTPPVDWDKIMEASKTDTQKLIEGIFALRAQTEEVYRLKALAASIKEKLEKKQETKAKK